MIHFPKSPLCLVWKTHDWVVLLQNPRSPVPSMSHCQQLTNLQAIVVTPNEDAVIFITSNREWSLRGLRTLVSKISTCRITKAGDSNYRTLGSVIAGETLNYHLDRPERCDIVIEEHTSSNTQVTVLIVHNNGYFEVKDVRLPP